jgi:C4-dicarboxylate-binding protein DctP
MKMALQILSIGVLSIFIGWPVFDLQAAEKTITAKFSLQFPPKHHLVRAANLFAKTVAEKSQGSIKIQVFPVGQIYKETEIVDAVRSLSVEVGDVLLERWGGFDELFDVLGANKYLVVGYDLAWRLADGKAGNYLSELMKKQGCYPIFWSCSGVYKGITNSKRPIVRPADLKGLLIRVSNAPIGETIKLFGGSPVLMSGGESYDAMQRKTVDGSETTLSSVFDRKYYEVQKYLSVYMDYPSYHTWIVNWKWWNDLPKEKREILRQAALAAQNWDRQELDDIEADYIKKLQKLMTTHMQTNAEADEWRKACQPISEGWLKKTGAEGKKLLDLVNETVKESKGMPKK